MAKRKLQGYFDRMGDEPANEAASTPVESEHTPEPDKHAPAKSAPKKTGKKPVAPSSKSSSKPSPAPAKKRSSKSAEKASGKPASGPVATPAKKRSSKTGAQPTKRDEKKPTPETVASSSGDDAAKPAEPRPASGSSAPKPSKPASAESAERAGKDAAPRGSAADFSRLEKTILASKTGADLSVPDLPEGMIDDIRRLKDLAQRKSAAPRPARAQPRRSHLEGDPADLLDALGSSPEPPVPEPAGPPPTPVAPAPAEPSTPEAATPDRSPSPGPAAQPGPSADSLADEFSDAGAQPDAAEKSEPSADQLDVEAFDRFLEENIAPSGPDARTPADPSPAPVTPKPGSASDVAPARSASDDAQAQPASVPAPNDAVDEASVTEQFERLLGTMRSINDELPGDGSDASDATAPEAAAPRAPVPKVAPSASSSSAPAQPASSSAPEPAAPSDAYDGSWISSCETISDVLDALEEVDAPIEQVRTTVALFVLGFSDALASIVRTAQNRDELELMLRHALTESIDDAFSRTGERLADERARLDHDAEKAAASFDEAESDAASAPKPAPAPAPEPAPIEPAETKKPEPPKEPATDPGSPEPSSAELLEKARATHASAESRAADDLSAVPASPAPKRLTLAGRIAKLIEQMHGLIESGEIDAAIESLGKARALLERQITLKEKRGEPTIDERMADFELKGLGLDLEILKARSG